MRPINLDSLPFLAHCFMRLVKTGHDTSLAKLFAAWWGIKLGSGCKFLGRARFKRHPNSQIVIGTNCLFNSSPASNFIGVNRPCMISTLKEDAKLTIGEDCGFSGTIIACAKQIVLGRNVSCGANTLINDTDWHTNDPRAGLDAEVIIGDNVWLGVNVIVLKGVTIGEGTLVGAGSLVTKSLPPYVIAGGNPARVIRKLN
ncbi:MAG: acyltransferase [Calditrichaeota bacterium]|nr:acyltransferase [Calditrichota bacterium]